MPMRTAVPGQIDAREVNLVEDGSQNGKDRKIAWYRGGQIDHLQFQRLIDSGWWWHVVPPYRHFFLPQSSSASRFTGRCSRVLHFEPVGRAARTVGRVLPLRHDTFEPHLAGVGED